MCNGRLRRWRVLDRRLQAVGASARLLVPMVPYKPSGEEATMRPAVASASRRIERIESGKSEARESCAVGHVEVSRFAYKELLTY